MWRAALQLPSARLEALAPTLSADERERAGRFVFPEHRERFIAARGVLRALLGRYLNRPPEQLEFRYSERGKPALDRADQDALCFNLSHSRDLALYAVTRQRQVGIDVEWVRADIADEQIAERFFSPAEVQVLKAVPAASRPVAFFTCWTRKEAYLKARGEGITVPLDGFAVSLRPGEPAALLSCERDSGEVSRWRLQELDPGAGYAAALCVEGRDWEHCCWQWPAEEPIRKPHPGVARLRRP